MPCRATASLSIYTKEGSQIIIEEIETSNISKELVFETAIIKIKAKKCNLILIGLYRPPTPNTDEFFLKLDELFQTFSTVKKTKSLLWETPT